MDCLRRAILAAAVLFTLAPGLLLAGCASTSARRPSGEFDAMFQERAKARIAALEADKPIQEAVGGLLKQPLSAEAAVQLALLGNPAYRGRLSELGIAQADLAQAALLENPKVHASLRFPTGGGGGQMGSEVGGTINFLDLLTLPLRRKLASAQLEQAKFRLGHETLELASAVKSAYFNLQSAKGRLKLDRAVLEGLDAAARLSRRQRRAGNVNQLDLDTQQLAYEEAKLELAQAETEELAARERLAALLGAQDRPWSIQEELRDPPATEPVLEKLEAAALSQRWDLAAARKEPSVIEQALRVNRLSLLGFLDVGVDSEREFDGGTGVGPEVEFAAPLFDRKQASSAKLKARLRQSQSTVAGLESQIRLQLRVAHAELAQARRAVESYQSELLPLRRRIVEETLKQYNFMLHGVYDLLKAKREEFGAQAAYIEVLRRYWLHWTELEQAAGGRIPLEALRPVTLDKGD